MTTFPKWITKESDNSYVINVDEAYPALMKELKLREQDLDKYWLEVMYQFVKLDLRRMLILNGLNPWPTTIKIRGDKKRWGQKNYKDGRGSEKATKGKEAKDLYKQMRGFIPG